MSYGQQDMEKNMATITLNFNREVIEETIESLRSKFNERGLSEDLLDRLKANWTKNLRVKIQQNHQEALTRHYQRLENATQIHKETAEAILQH